MGALFLIPLHRSRIRHEGLLRELITICLRQFVNNFLVRPSSLMGVLLDSGLFSSTLGLIRGGWAFVLVFCIAVHYWGDDARDVVGGYFRRMFRLVVGTNWSLKWRSAFANVSTMSANVAAAK